MKNLLPKKDKIYLDFASAVHKQMKQMRYGIDTVSATPDLDLSVIRKDMVDWQANEDHNALTEASYNYQINTTYLPLSYDPQDREATVGGAMEDPSLLQQPGIRQSFNYYDPAICRQDMRQASITKINYNTGNGQNGQNVIDVNSGGCITRINLNNTVNVKTQSFQFDQDTPSTLWDIQHGLGFEPNVRTEDLQGVDIIGSVEHVTVNRLRISFNQAVAGKAYLS